MRSIYKYTLVLHDTQVIKLPRNSKIIHVGTQWNQLENQTTICLWVEVHADYLDDLVNRRFDIHGTGHIILRDDSVHIGTVQMPTDSQGIEYVWHIYEVPYDI